MEKETDKKLKAVLDTTQFLNPISMRLILNEMTGQINKEEIKTWFIGKNNEAFLETDYQFYRIMKSQSTIVIPSVEQSRLLSNLEVEKSAAIFAPIRSEFGYCGCFWACFEEKDFNERTQILFGNFQDWITEIITNDLRDNFGIQIIASRYSDFLEQLNTPALIVIQPDKISISNPLFEAMHFKEKVIQMIRSGLSTDSGFDDLFDLYHCELREIKFPGGKTGKLFLFHPKEDTTSQIVFNTNELEYIEMLIQKVNGTLDLLNTAGELNLVQTNYRGMAEMELRRLSTVVRYKKKHFSHFRNSQEGIFETILIGDIVKEVIYDLKPIAKKKKLDILFEIDKIEGSRSQKGKIIGDAWLLTMAVYNLVDNAIRYSKSESKPIKVDLKYQIDSWVLSVQDDGIGISPLDMQKISEEPISFMEGSESTIINGIQFVKYVARLHKGKLQIESKLGKGSTFTFEAPYY